MRKKVKTCYIFLKYKLLNFNLILSLQLKLFPFLFVKLFHFQEVLYQIVHYLGRILYKFIASARISA